MGTSKLSVTGCPVVALPSFIHATRDSGYKSTAAAISELLDNSIEAGATRVDIRVFESDSAERSIEIEVLDNGTGMPEKMLPMALSPTRDAGYFLQELATSGNHSRGRKPQNVFHAGHIRRLSQEVDSATLEVLPTPGCKSFAGRTVAEVTSVSTRQQGEDQEHHERPVQPRHSLGMDHAQSHYLRSAKCEAQKYSGHSDHRANQVLPFASEGALPYRCHARCLKWEDVNFETLEVNLTRSVVKQKITRCKTEASRKPIPLDAELAEILLSWKLQSPYPQSSDWVFASPHKKGKQPYWPGALFRAHLEPALKAAKIPGDVGWHTFRHTFGTLMKANGEDIKTIQELLRHSNYKVTADTYMQAITSTKRAAQTKLVRMILPAKAAAGEKA